MGTCVYFYQNVVTANETLFFFCGETVLNKGLSVSFAVTSGQETQDPSEIFEQSLVDDSGEMTDFGEPIKRKRLIAEPV